MIGWRSGEGKSFAGRPNAFAQVYSYGHRNIQGLAIHPLTGDVWARNARCDELNLIGKQVLIMAGQ